MDAEARALLRTRTSSSADWPLANLAQLKAASGTTISVILPALNEEATVGPIVEYIRRELMDGPGEPFVDELLVLDSGSTDATGEVAANAGALVLHRDDVLPRIPTVTGKGEAMWRAVAATIGDLVVFVDADLHSFTAEYVTGLLGPLLTDPDISLVKAVYERPLTQGSHLTPVGGGRVTEMVARPLLNLYWPGLAGIIQPLAGEYAGRRELLEQLPFPCGYGVDFALLVDSYELLGAQAIAQVDLGVRLHRHHDDKRLGRMAAEILQTAWSRLDADGQLRRNRGMGTSLAQFDNTASGYAVASYDISGLERPALASIPEYRAARVSGAIPGVS